MSLGVMKAAERNRDSEFSRIKGGKARQGGSGQKPEISIPRYMRDVKFRVSLAGIPTHFIAVVSIGEPP